MRSKLRTLTVENLTEEVLLFFKVRKVLSLVVISERSSVSNIIKRSLHPYFFQGETVSSLRPDGSFALASAPSEKSSLHCSV